MFKKKRTKLSNFDREESFDYTDIPHHFDSVSKEGLEKLSEDCSRAIAEDFGGNTNPTAIEAIVAVINGKFDDAYATLEGDYNARRTNLETAYSEGKKDLHNQIEDFKLLVDKHNLAYKAYYEALEAATGNHPNTNLYFDNLEMEKIDDGFRSLGKD